MSWQLLVCSGSIATNSLIGVYAPCRNRGVAGERFAALCLFAPCTKFQVTTNVDGANSTKPLLYAGTVD
jgi:hypothetical protein